MGFSIWSLTIITKIKQSLATCCLAACITGASTLNAEPITFKIDPVHSGVSFKIRHFFAKTPGTFDAFSGTVTFDPNDAKNNSVEAQIELASVDTNNSDRDDHLRSADYFDTSKHQYITYKSSSWKKGEGENKYIVTGDLTMFGKTQPVALEVEFLGMGEGQGPMAGIKLAGFSAETEIDRTKWGLTAGTPAVGEMVEISLEIEAHHKLND